MPRTGSIARSVDTRYGRLLVRASTDKRAGHKKRPRRETAQAIAALSIGGMVVARTLVQRDHADELRPSCIAAALELGGWEDAGNTNEIKSLRSASGPNGKASAKRNRPITLAV